MSEPVVSICSITYNHAPYIRQCLDGFLMQKTNFPFEIIINDDCSTDGTTEIIKEYAEKYPDLIKPIFHEENQYKKGVRGMFVKYVFPKAQGKYLALCEGDDYWIDPQKLQKQVDFLEAHPDYLLCGTNGLILWDNGTNAPEYFNRNFTSRELMPEDVIGKWPFPTASLMCRRELFALLDSFKCRTYNGDIRIILVALANGRIWSLADITTVYRKNNDANSSTNRVKAKKDHGEFYFGQMIKLYSSYDIYTDHRFKDFINIALTKDKKRLKVIKLRKKIGLLAFIIYPVISYNYILKLKISGLLKSWNYQHL